MSKYTAYIRRLTTSVVALLFLLAFADIFRLFASVCQDGGDKPSSYMIVRSLLCVPRSPSTTTEWVIEDILRDSPCLEVSC